MIYRLEFQQVSLAFAQQDQKKVIRLQIESCFLLHNLHVESASSLEARNCSFNV